MPVALPVGAFLQATADGEAVLVEAVREAVGWRGAHRRPVRRARDLRICAGRAGDRGRSVARRGAGAASPRPAARPPDQVEHRDLYRRPYDAKELAAFDAVVLDPPRAGRKEQVKQLAASAVPRIAYVSCNPATFARDAEILAAGGYRLDWARPVGQFRWSTHVELAAAFSR